MHTGQGLQADLTAKLPSNTAFSPTAPAGRNAIVHSVNIGATLRLQMQGRSVLSAIGKAAVQGAVPVGRLGLLGDEQADLSLHGGLDKAVYAYPIEHYAFWQTQRRTHSVSLFDEVLAPGFVGENLTLEGLLESDVWIGDELHFSHCVLREIGRAHV